ncbi:MAG TPA: class I SAM-dependent methyltransferase [Streptosporangiaceae bacterium]|nr:class I SAM-dependent methyltransferase [Streptosporangiaceae bacterium]
MPSRRWGGNRGPHGTGKATLPLARRGFLITCIEIGAELAGQARHNLAGWADLQVVQDALETWQPPARAGYDLVFAATSWHWIDPAVGLAGWMDGWMAHSSPSMRMKVTSIQPHRSPPRNG